MNTMLRQKKQKNNKTKQKENWERFSQVDK